MATVTREELGQVVVAVDPAVSVGEDSDETGIIVVARGPHQDTCHLPKCPGHGYVLQDATCKMAPSGWARRAVALLDHWDANRIVAERNNGGDMVGETIRAVRPSVPYTTVWASRGKLTRAEPASALYEQGRVHHLGTFEKLEDQLTTWTPDSGESPDRLDALVWGLTALKLITWGGRPLLFDDDDVPLQDPLGKPFRTLVGGGLAAGSVEIPRSVNGRPIAGPREDQEDNGKVVQSPFA